nr:MAG: polyprotein [Picornavirales sp.]
MQNIPSISNNLYTQVDIDDAYRIDAKPFIERPFYAGSVTFTNTDQRYALLSSPINSLPGDIIRSNPSLLNAMKIGSYYRADLVLNISMAGTITHAGKILVGAVPPLPVGTIQSTKDWINIIQSGPHASLFANEATSVVLTIPWYCNSDLATLDMDTGTPTSLDITPVNGNYSNLLFLVQNPLAPSAGSSQSLSIIIEACFKHLDILVPTPRLVKWVPQSLISQAKTLKEAAKTKTKNVVGDFIDGSINWLTSWIGLHNPNLPVIQERDVVIQRNFPNVVDSEQYIEKLDPYSNFDRVVQSPIFGTTVDEMSISHITSKRQFLGSFIVSQEDSVGKLYWSRPISPFQGGFNNTNDEVRCINNIELMHSLHRAWRGGLEIIIESVMNNKQQVKLRLLKMYNPSTEAAIKVPTYSTIANAPSALMEFTQGGQEHVVSLPYLCRNDLTPCAEDLSLEGLFHGMYYIYLAQPLANSDGSPMTIEFNVYMRGAEDLTFYGYVARNLVPTGFPVISNSPSNFKPQSGENSIRVMNEPQKQVNEVSIDHKARSASHFERLLPSLDIRPLIRRMYPLQAADAITMQPNQIFTEIVPLADILGETPFNAAIPVRGTPISIVSRMYYGKTVGFKFQIRLQSYKQGLTDVLGAEAIQVSFSYVPPNFSYDGSNSTVTGCEVNADYVEPTTIPQYLTPFPFQDIPPIDLPNSKLYEFFIPDVTLYKFMGSPNKLLVSNSYQKLSTMDFGSLYIRYSNADALKMVIVKRNTYVGLSDESRFGLHSLASPFIIEKQYSPYFSEPGVLPTGLKPPSMYVGGF